MVIDVNTITSLVPAIGIIVALSYYILNLQSNTKTRQAQLFMQIHNRWNDRIFISNFMDLLNLWEWNDADEFWKKYGQHSNHDAFVSLTSILWYFESVGILLRRKLIDVNLIDELYSDRYIRFWKKIEPILQEIKEDFDNPHYYSNCEYLHDELKLVHQSRE